MEAASRPVFEPLADLPVEAPIDEGVPVGAAPSPSGGSAQARSRKAGTEDDSTEELIDPESLLGTSEPDLLLAALNEAASSAFASSAPAAAPASTAFVKDAEDLLGLDELLLTEEPGGAGGPGAAVGPGSALQGAAAGQPAVAGQAAASGSAQGGASGQPAASQSAAARGQSTAGPKTSAAVHA